MISKSKRKEIEDTIYKFYHLLDPTDINKTEWENKLSGMSDEKFDKFIKDFLKDDNKHFKINIKPYYNDLEMKNIKKTLDFLKVPMFEKIALPFENEEIQYIDENGDLQSAGTDEYWTQVKVPVGYVHIKRLQQMVSKKNSMSTDTSKRSAITGQVTGDDKNSRVSDMENIALITLDSPEIMKEMLCAKSDDFKMKTEMLNQIKNTGMVDLSNIKSNPQDKVALNTLDVYFICAGIKTDLITDGLLLKSTMDKINKNNTTNISTKYNK